MNFSYGFCFESVSSMFHFDLNKYSLNKMLLIIVAYALCINYKQPYRLGPIDLKIYRLERNPRL
jgi:hypothetical protein